MWFTDQTFTTFINPNSEVSKSYSVSLWCKYVHWIESNNYDKFSLRGVVKIQIFYGRAGGKGGGGGVNPFGPDRRQIRKFWSIEIWFFDTPNKFYLIMRGEMKPFILRWNVFWVSKMHLSCPLRLHYTPIRPWPWQLQWTVRKNWEFKKFDDKGFFLV